VVKKKVREYNENYINRKRKAAHEFEDGDLVMVKNFDATGGKLAPAYRGTRRLKNKRYVVADIEGCQISQRPYQGTWEAAKMKPWRKESEQSEYFDTESEKD